MKRFTTSAKEYFLSIYFFYQRFTDRIHLTVYHYTEMILNT